MKILVVEDEATWPRLLCRALESLGNSCSAGARADEAERLLEHEQPSTP